MLGPASLRVIPMDAIQTGQANVTYSDKPPVIIGASSEAAIGRAQRTIGASSCRLGATLPIDRVAERMTVQVSAAIVWLEIDRDGGREMDELLTRVSIDASAGRYAAIVSGTREIVDPLIAGLDDSSVEILIDADEPQRIAALAVAASRAQLPSRLSDVAADQNAARLRQLSDEVSRIAATLARLSTGPGAPTRQKELVPKGEVPEVSAETVRSVIRARRLRTRYFAEELFADPAWDMLLDLLQAEIAQLRVPVSSLCIAAAVPATTALRWLKTMVGEGLFLRRADPHDGRRVFVELAPHASQALRRYFAEIGSIVAV